MADKRVAAAFHEVYNDVPKNVKKTGKTGAAKRKMLTAIALSKARAAGANIPLKGGNDTITKDSMKYEMLSGRKDNLAGKAAFKSGPIARTDPKGSSTHRTDSAAAEGVCS